MKSSSLMGVVEEKNTLEPKYFLPFSVVCWCDLSSPNSQTHPSCLQIVLQASCPIFSASN
jgi:hypothetical protein